MLFDNIAFAEQLVSPKKTPKVTLLRVLAVIAGIVVFVAACIILTLFIPADKSSWSNFGGGILAAAIFFGLYMVWRYTSPEFEYTFLDGDFDVVKIFGKAKRKKYLSFIESNIETIGIMNEENKAHYSGIFHKKYDITSGKADTEIWFINIAYETGRHELLIFDPSEKMLTALRKGVKKRKFLN